MPQNPVTGGLSQITELRAGHSKNDGNFVDAPGGSLINDRAIDALVQERVPDSENIRTLRMSLNILGDGFVEAIDDTLIRAIASTAGATPGSDRGKFIQVPVLEAPGQTRVGRFGWKNQHASLLSFSADAYLNEMGDHQPAAAHREHLDGQFGRGVRHGRRSAKTARTNTCGERQDIERSPTSCARPKRRRATRSSRPRRRRRRGDHVRRDRLQHLPRRRRSRRAPAGTVINGGTFTVPAALGNKIIHPFSDFLLHNVGTGDGIVQNGGQATRATSCARRRSGACARTIALHARRAVADPDRCDPASRGGGQRGDQEVPVAERH